MLAAVHGPMIVARVPGRLLLHFVVTTTGRTALGRDKTMEQLADKNRCRLARIIAGLLEGVKGRKTAAIPIFSDYVQHSHPLFRPTHSAPAIPLSLKS
jgi:hypothetical protein